LVNGYPTNWFDVESGVRQGCPIAPLLYAISTEPLRAFMEKDSCFTGLVIDNIRLTVQMYADDTNGFVKDKKDVERILENFKLHEDASAALLNKSKCSAIIIGGLNKEDLAPFRVLNDGDFEWLLGVPFGPGDTNKIAIDRITERFNRKLDIWKNWPLSIFGRTMVGNTSILAHLWRASQFIVDTKDVWKRFRLAYWNYIQPGNFMGKIKYDVAVNKKMVGGIGAIEPKREIHALKAHWIARMLNNMMILGQSFFGWKSNTLHWNTKSKIQQISNLGPKI
jgi:hypothetical protein